MRIAIANFQGTGLLSSGVKFFTDSIYSHSAIVLLEDMTLTVDGKEYFLKRGNVFEAWWPGGVHLSPDYGLWHPGHIRVDLFSVFAYGGLAEADETEVIRFLIKNLGKKYDLLNVFRFIPLVRLLIPDPAPYSYDRTHVFCSELVLEALAKVGCRLLERIAFWKVPPGGIPTSPLIQPIGYFFTDDHEHIILHSDSE